MATKRMQQGKAESLPPISSLPPTETLPQGGIAELERSQLREGVSPVIHDLENYIKSCNDQHKIYKEGQEKILYFITSTFTLVLGATGLFGVASEKPVKFELTHILLFDVLFMITWLFYLYKKLNASMYAHSAHCATRYLRSITVHAKRDDLLSLDSIKEKYMGQSSHPISARAYANFAGMLMILTYILLSCIAVKGNSDFDIRGVQLDWPPIFVATAFTAAMIGIHFVAKRSQKRIVAAIAEDWKAVPVAKLNSGA